MTMNSIIVVAVLGCGFTAPSALAHHDHHEHGITIGEKHDIVRDDTRFFTDRGIDMLDLPVESDAFTFAIFGDRTSGPREGIAVLEQAVEDVNVLEPDLVMTVGDLIQGYSGVEPWMEEMDEYKAIMSRLLCPWFPVAGNHDTYWRGPDRPENEHEDNYEMHFGPLWYSFEHKDCHFIVLYTDEGDPDTGERTFRKPASQRMSPEQISWLEQALERAADATHVFVFVHHPRWLGGQYGNDWEKVHKRLADAGNVRAVFAGHIHRMRYDGPRDGIEYVTLATTGGSNQFHSDDAGYLHHFHLITVRPTQIAMTALPVGEVMDVREVTGQISDDAAILGRTLPAVLTPVRVSASGRSDGYIDVEIENPVGRPIEITVYPESDDSRWVFTPDHIHDVIDPQDSTRVQFGVQRVGGALDDTFDAVDLVQETSYLTEHARFNMRTHRVTLPMQAALPAPSAIDVQRVLSLDGSGDCLEVLSDNIVVPDGPLTVECWFRADALDGRIGLLAKTEDSEYGLFVSDGTPTFSIHLDGAYTNVGASSPMLRTGTWHHIAGVYNGSEARLYVDGRLVQRTPASGERTKNELPFLIGADVNGRGEAMSFFEGEIDVVRVSTTARYALDGFTPKPRLRADADTVLLLNMDARYGPFVYDESGRHAHPTTQGDANLVATE